MQKHHFYRTGSDLNERNQLLQSFELFQKCSILPQQKKVIKLKGGKCLQKLEG